MTYTSHELEATLLGLLTLPVFFLAPGYVIASFGNLMQFRRQGWIERLLWSVAVSAPVSLLIANHPGRFISPAITTGSFVVLFVAFLILFVRDLRADSSSSLRWDRYTTLGVLGAVFLLGYCILGSLPIQTHHGLWESSIWQDWGVRIQLVNAAIRGGNVPANPMFAPGGEPAPLRYYYFWYILCARMHDIVPMTARAAFNVSCVGASFSLLAFLFLAVKYLGEREGSLRRTCVALMFASCILGLDLLALFPLTLTHHVFPNTQFWLEDRTPRLLQVILWSPHHAAGLVCAGLGVLLLVCCLELTPRQRVLHVVLASICFAAGAGTSTFITALFGSALFFVLVDAAFRKEWAPIWMTAIAAAIALLLDAAFLHQLLATHAGAGHAGATPEPLLHPLPRHMGQTLHIIWAGLDQFGRHFLRRRIYPIGQTPQGTMRLLLSMMHHPTIPALFLLDMGFFAYVLFWQARQDFFVARPMSRAARVRWMIFLGIGIPGSRFTSAALQSNNDFARHAGLGMEFVLLLWSAPILVRFADRWRARQRGGAPVFTWPQRAALACAALGLLGQVVQIAYDRLRVPLTDAGFIHRVVIAEYVPRFGFRSLQIEQAMEAAAHATSGDSIVQQNPHTLLSPVFLLYTQRQMAASDDGCNTPFGGDPADCLPMTRALIKLYGGTGKAYFTDLFVLQKPIEFNPSLVTVENFRNLCSANKISVMAATYTDPVWWYKQSWVWSLQPIYSNSTVRLYRCDAATI